MVGSVRFSCWCPLPKKWLVVGRAASDHPAERVAFSRHLEPPAHLLQGLATPQRQSQAILRVHQALGPTGRPLLDPSYWSHVVLKGHEDFWLSFWFPCFQPPNNPSSSPFSWTSKSSIFTWKLHSFGWCLRTFPSSGFNHRLRCV